MAFGLSRGIRHTWIFVAIAPLACTASGEDPLAERAIPLSAEDPNDPLVRERMRRELFAAVSHDLRTPITALGLLATAIDDSIVAEAKRREYARRMNTHVRQVGALIDDLFDLTRLQA